MNITEKRTAAILQIIADRFDAEWCADYGEPGYHTPAAGVILANWNDVPGRLADYLETAGYSLEWSDEWLIDYDHGKAWRTQADSYSWQSSVMYTDDCELITPDDGAAEFIAACEMADANQPARALPAWVTADDLLAKGYELVKHEYESGFFPGQTDDPESIARALFSEGAEKIVFQLSENSQFYSRFRAWAVMSEGGE